MCFEIEFGGAFGLAPGYECFMLWPGANVLLFSCGSKVRPKDVGGDFYSEGATNDHVAGKQISTALTNIGCGE